MKSNKKILFKNTLMLYILRFSGYFFGFITVPYQTRIMGNVIYGKIGVATALMVYFQLFLDYGFILSATEDIVKNRENHKKICEIFTSVTAIKVMFSILSLVFLTILCIIVPQYKADFWLYFWFLIGAIINALIPDFVYRGIEDMAPITYRTLVSKAIFTLFIFFILKDKNDYIMVPILTLIGNLAALIWSFIDMKKRYNYFFTRINIKNMINALKKSTVFFLSRIAGTIYSTANTIIIGLVDYTGITVGLYTAANKLITTGQGALAPISDSIYPYMVKNKDFKLIKKILIICMPIIIIGAIIIWIFSGELCSLIFGEEFYDAKNILRAMLPLAVVTLPDYLLGFPTLSAMGLTKHANYSIYITTVFHIICLFIVYKLGMMTAVTLAVLISISTIIETLYRAAVIYFNRDKLN